MHAGCCVHGLDPGAYGAQSPIKIAVDCREYIESYLAAQADGELSAEELHAADKHLAVCARCQARLAQEHELKAVVRKRVRTAMAPAELRAAIHSALDRAGAERGRRRWLGDAAAEFARPKIWAPILALAASIVFVVTMRGRIAREAPIAEFDPVVQKFTAFERHFEPNVPLSFAAIAEHYHSAKAPAFIWNFGPVGFQLAGGRIDRLPDGSPITYTLYRGPRGSVMCTRFKVDRITIPPGGRELRTDQYLYEYKGCSLVLTVDYERRWICILMSRLPAREFGDDILALEG